MENLSREQCQERLRDLDKIPFLFVTDKGKKFYNFGPRLSWIYGTSFVAHLECIALVGLSFLTSHGVFSLHEVSRIWGGGARGEVAIVLIMYKSVKSCSKSVKNSSKSVKTGKRGSKVKQDLNQ